MDSDESTFVSTTRVERIVRDIGAVITVAMFHAKGDPTRAISKLEENRGQVQVASVTGFEADVVDLAQQAINAGGEVVEAENRG